MSAQTYIDLAIGRLKGPEAFFRRKLRYSGDMKLLLKMHKMFPALFGGGRPRPLAPAVTSGA